MSRWPIKSSIFILAPFLGGSIAVLGGLIGSDLIVLVGAGVVIGAVIAVLLVVIIDEVR